MYNYNDSTAYDFDLFTEKKKVVEIPDAPKKRGRAKTGHSQKAAPSFRSRLVAVAMVLGMLALIIAQIQCQSQNAEVVAEITKAEKTLEALKSEETRMMMELEEKVSFTNMEKVADEMGMQKITAAQTRYVNLCDQDKSEVLDSGGNFAAVMP